MEPTASPTQPRPLPCFASPWMRGFLDDKAHPGRLGFRSAPPTPGFPGRDRRGRTEVGDHRAGTREGPAIEEMPIGAGGPGNVVVLSMSASRPIQPPRPHPCPAMHPCQALAECDRLIFEGDRQAPDSSVPLTARLSLGSGSRSPFLPVITSGAGGLSPFVRGASCHLPCPWSNPPRHAPVRPHSLPRSMTWRSASGPSMDRGANPPTWSSSAPCTGWGSRAAARTCSPRTSRACRRGSTSAPAPRVTSATCSIRRSWSACTSRPPRTTWASSSPGPSASTATTSAST